MPNKRTRRLRAVRLLSGVLLFPLLTGCGNPSGASDPANAVTVRICHLTDYAWQDRNRTGQPVDFKAEAACEALYQSLQSPNADVLIVRGLGSQAAFERLEQALTQQDSSLEGQYLPGPTPFEGLGFFLRTPEVPVQNQVSLSLADDTYEVEGRTYAPLAAGIFAGDTWLWNAVWPEPTENYERRRNEARLLTQKLRPLIQEGQSVLLSLHSREAPDSPMFRFLEELGLVRVSAADERGDQWTHRDPEGITYRQDQWIFATPELADRIEARILDTPEIRLAGEYRHQLLTLTP